MLYFHIRVFDLTRSLSLTTISSMYLVSVWTEGLRTDLLDLLTLADACCSLVSGGLSSSSPSPPLRSHSVSSVQSGHRREQSYSHLTTLTSPFQSQHHCPSFSQTFQNVIASEDKMASGNKTIKREERKKKVSIGSKYLDSEEKV